MGNDDTGDSKTDWGRMDGGKEGKNRMDESENVSGNKIVLGERCETTNDMETII